MAFSPISMSTRIFERRNSIVTWWQKRPVIVVKDGPDYFAMDAVCAHMGCAVLTEAEGHLVTCPAHGAQFDVRTGALVTPARVRPEQPCSEENMTVPLRTYPIRERDGFLEMETPD